MRMRRVASERDAAAEKRPGVEGGGIRVGVPADVGSDVDHLADGRVPVGVEATQVVDVAGGVPGCVFVGGLRGVRVAVLAADDGEEAFAERGGEEGAGGAPPVVCFGEDVVEAGDGVVFGELGEEGDGVDCSEGDPARPFGVGGWHEGTADGGSDAIGAE